MFKKIQFRKGAQKHAVICCQPYSSLYIFFFYSLELEKTLSVFYLKTTVCLVLTDFPPIFILFMTPGQMLLLITMKKGDWGLGNFEGQKGFYYVTNDTTPRLGEFELYPLDKVKFFDLKFLNIF